jgi:transposase InsO family protein
VTDASSVTVQQVCRAVDMSRANFYTHRKARRRREVDEALVLELVHRERRVQPQLGLRKLLHLIGPDLADAGVKIGRDRFRNLLFRYELLIERKRNYCRTTNSWHGFGVYPNRLKDAELTGPNQAWVSDITYLRTASGFVYLALITDAFSRAIIGWDCSDSLEAVGAMRALKMALRGLPKGCPPPIHHSDRGCQYCCGDYIALLKRRRLSISITEENHCYENAQAERVNGILKQEYGLGQTLHDPAEARRMARQAIDLYNYRRPHLALNMAFPMTVHHAA